MLIHMFFYFCFFAHPPTPPVCILAVPSLFPFLPPISPFPSLLRILFVLRALLVLPSCVAWGPHGPIGLRAHRAQITTGDHFLGPQGPWAPGAARPPPKALRPQGPRLSLPRGPQGPQAPPPTPGRMGPHGGSKPKGPQGVVCRVLCAVCSVWCPAPQVNVQAPCFC
jgi:hypothetical protein